MPGTRGSRVCLSEPGQGHLEGHRKGPAVPGGSRREEKAVSVLSHGSAAAEQRCWSANASSCAAAELHILTGASPSLPRAAEELLHLPPKALPKGKISAQENEFLPLSLLPRWKRRVTVAFTSKSIKKH